MRVQDAVTKTRISVVALITTACIGGFICVQSQEPAPPTKNYVRLAQVFLTSLYPELNGKGYVMSLESSFRYDFPMIENSAFDLYVGVGPKNMIVGYLGGYEGTVPHKEPLHAGPVTARQLLISSFEFQDGNLISFGAKGPAVGNQEKYQQVVSQLVDQPDMTDAEAATILKQAGARYGPTDKDDFLKHLPLEKLSPFVGSATLIAATLPSVAKEGLKSRWPEWHVRAKAKPAGRQESTYEMWFEPFRGDLVRLSEVREQH
jgi:hypothetical protein